MNQEPTSFLEELKRRNVVRVGVVYLIAAWLLAQVADLFLENFNAPDWVIQAILLVLIIGFPLALIFAWAYELTPEGLKKERDVDRSQSITRSTGRKLDFVIIGILAVALGYFIWESRFDDSRFKGSEPFSEAASIASVGDAADAAAEKGSDPISASPAKPVDATPSIAVLPFVNMSSDPEQEYFSDGISEEILNSLAKVRDLKVAGRTSSFAFKGENQDLRQVGETLGVEHILEGSVRKSGAKVRITAQLIQVEDGFHLWSESYDRELNDVFEIQDEIATAILEQLKLHLLEDSSQLAEAKAAISSPRADTEAYDLYLLAKQRMYERTGPTIESAVELLDRAIAIDPDYAPAYAQRGITALLLAEGTGSYGDIPLDQALSQARLYLDKALQIDPEQPEALAGMGLYFNNQPVPTDKGLPYLRRALEINPNLLDASNWLAIGLGATGRLDEAKRVVEDMVERDPLYRPGVRNMVNYQNWFGESEKAREYLERVRPLIPNDANIASSEAAINLQEGRLAEALRLAEHSVALQPSNSVARMTRGFILMQTQQLERLAAEGEEWQPIVALHWLGRTEEATRLAQTRLEKFADVETWIYLLNLNGRSADAAAYIDENWATIDELQQAFPPSAPVGYTLMLEVAYAYMKAGNQQKFDEALQRLIAANSELQRQGVSNIFFFATRAAEHALAGDIENSLAMLDKAVSGGFVSMVPRIARDFPALEPLEGDPRFEAIQARMIEHVNAERAQLSLEPVET